MTVGNAMYEAEFDDKAGRSPKRTSWWGETVAARLVGAATVALRGCFHEKMSWPIGVDGYSYQVCLGCGVKRLFDEGTFSAYGPYRYDLKELAAWRRRNSEAMSRRERMWH
jgi:hypothetical protein